MLTTISVMSERHLPHPHTHDHRDENSDEVKSRSDIRINRKFDGESLDPIEQIAVLLFLIGFVVVVSVMILLVIFR